MGHVVGEGGGGAHGIGKRTGGGGGRCGRRGRGGVGGGVEGGRGGGEEGLVDVVRVPGVELSGGGKGERGAGAALEGLPRSVGVLDVGRCGRRVPLGGSSEDLLEEGWLGHRRRGRGRREDGENETVDVGHTPFCLSKSSLIRNV